MADGEPIPKGVDATPRQESRTSRLISNLIQRGGALLGRREQPKERIDHSQDLLRDARHNLDLYAPQLLPTQPTQLVAQEGDDFTDGEYLGEFGGTHYLEICFGNKPQVMEPKKREFLQTIVTHELVHQKQFEMVNTTSGSSTHDTGSSSIETANLISQQIVDLLRERKKAHELSDLQSALLEGFAMQVELHVLEKRIEAARASGDQKGVDILTEVYQYRAEPLKDVQTAGADYFDGSKIASDLIKTFGLDRLSYVMQAIDFQGCGNIKAGTPEYAAIINNPKSLPGLENLDSNS